MELESRYRNRYASHLLRRRRRHSVGGESMNLIRGDQYTLYIFAERVIIFLICSGSVMHIYTYTKIYTCIIFISEAEGTIAKNAATGVGEPLSIFMNMYGWDERNGSLVHLYVFFLPLSSPLCSFGVAVELEGVLHVESEFDSSL